VYLVKGALDYNLQSNLLIETAFLENSGPFASRAASDNANVLTALRTLRWRKTLFMNNALFYRDVLRIVS